MRCTLGYAAAKGSLLKIDGTYYAAIAAPDSKARVLSAEGAFINKNGRGNGTVLNVENNSPQVTSGTPQRANAPSAQTIPHASINSQLEDARENIEGEGFMGGRFSCDYS